jgi:hypothetical protein
MMEYIIIKSLGGKDEQELEDLQYRVNLKTAQGWKPQGGIAVRAGSLSGAYFLQAMVREGK